MTLITFTKFANHSENDLITRYQKRWTTLIWIENRCKMQSSSEATGRIKDCLTRTARRSTHSELV